MNFRPIVDVTMLAWFILEISRNSYRLSRRNPEDHGSSIRIFVLLAVCFIISFIFRRAGAGTVTIPDWLGWGSIGIMVFGIAFRQYAITVLGAYFSPVIRVQEGQQLIQSGPYRYIRHPTYAGMLLAFYSAGLALGNWIILAAFVLLPTIAIVRRIKAEELMLERHFGKIYREYRLKTRALIPFLY